MVKTTNCNIKEEVCTVYSGRGKGGVIPIVPQEYGSLGNPIKIGKLCQLCGQVHKDGGSTLPCYKLYLLNKLKTDNEFKHYFFTLKGEKLGCFCKPLP